MTVFLNVVIAFFAGGESGGYLDFYNKYLNYPGFEAWRFINLAIFIAIIAYVFKKYGILDRFRARRDEIRAALLRAEKEKEAAMKRLQEVEQRLAGLENERNKILAEARAEAEAERVRLLREAEEEVKRINNQAGIEISRLRQQMRAEIKRFAAEESIRLAEVKLSDRVNEEVDKKLVHRAAAAIGGSR